jgi:hypothetical protein
MPRSVSTKITAFLVAIGALGFSSCAPSGFQDEKVIQSVRILASIADTPYARPGSTVKLQVLAYDGRATKPEPMTISWLPFVCKNPLNDAYYGCFQQFADAARGGGAADGGAEAAGGTPGREGGAGGLQTGIDLTPLLSKGASFQFVMPSDAVATHDTLAGAPFPYGLAILFNIACAGHIEFVPLDPGNVQSPPIGCFDAQHNRLGPDDYVFGFTRVFAYDQLTNANPVIESIDVDGQPVRTNSDGTWPPISKARCVGNCPKVHIGPIVPPSSQEMNPGERDVNGNVLKESIWAAFFSTVGSWDDGVRLLYDSNNGSVGGPTVTDNQFRPPSDPGDGFLWIVVHDNRGGAAWATLPVHTM